MRNDPMIGAVLLISGTALGAGMLAIPVITSHYGWITSLLLFSLCWMFMTLSAFFMLETNLCLKSHTNILSMAKATLGKAGALVTWLSYVFLLYLLMTAYIESMSDLVLSLTRYLPESNLYHWVGVSILLTLMGITLFIGTNMVDAFNRGLMIGLMISLTILCLFLAPHIEIRRLIPTQPEYALRALPVLVTAFGYQIVIPSLRSYLKSNVSHLKTAITIGSLVPLIVYIIWETVILGAIPLSGRTGLFQILISGQPVNGLMLALQKISGNFWTLWIARLTMFFLVATSFVGVSLSLFDFLADGLHMKKSRLSRTGILTLTFIPPILLAILFPKAFVQILGYGGVFVAILLILMPAMMVMGARYKKLKSPYKAPGGRVSILFTMAFAIGVIVVEFWH